MELDLGKIDLSKPATWNIWNQFNLDLDTYKGKSVSVDENFMPQEEQDKLIEYMLDNLDKLSAYKLKDKNMVKEQMQLERKELFPKCI